MVLLEIAAQGVRGFAPARGRAALRPGYNVLPAEGGAVRLLSAALLQFDRPVDPALRPEGPGGAARAGLTFTGNDGVTWRIVRDLGGGFQVQRYDGSHRAFQALGGSPAAAIDALRAAGVPAPGRMAALSVIGADFPSRQAVRAARVAPSPASVPRDALVRRLEAARDELARARGAHHVQERIEVLQHRQFRIEEIARAGEALRARVAEAVEALAPLSGAAAALGRLADVPAEIAAAERATARRDEALSRIEAERSEQEEQARAVPALLRSPTFVGGLSLGAIFLAAGAVSPLGWVALFAIPSTALAAVEGLRWVSRSEAAEAAGRRSRVLAERERKARETWERETAAVQGALAASGVTTLAELRDLWERVAEAREARDAIEAELGAWESIAENRDAEAERARVQREIGDLEAELTGGGGGFLREAASVEQEIARLEREVETGPFGTVPVDGVSEAPAPVVDPFRALVERSAQELGLTPGEAMRAAQQRVLQLLPAVSGQRLTSFLLDPSGGLQVQAGGRLVAVGQLGPAEQDACYAVLAVAFLDLGLAAGPRVGFVDDAFGSLPEGSRRVLARALRDVARGRQIVHGTSDPIFREAADAAG